MIRVLRLLEYTYPTVEAMADDQRRWAAGTNGVYQPNSKTTIRSAVLPLDVITDDRLTREALLSFAEDARAFPEDHGALVEAFLGGYPLTLEHPATVELEREEAAFNDAMETS